MFIRKINDVEISLRYRVTQAKIYDLKIPKFVIPIKSEEYPTLANRPAYSVLDNTKFITKFGNICSNLDLAISSTVSFIKESGIK